jgi:hypothetical protein
VWPGAQEAPGSSFLNEEFIQQNQNFAGSHRQTILERRRRNRELEKECIRRLSR